MFVVSKLKDSKVHMCDFARCFVRACNLVSLSLSLFEETNRREAHDLFPQKMYYSQLKWFIVQYFK
jgi:hypothetical protein